MEWEGRPDNATGTLFRPDPFRLLYMGLQTMIYFFQIKSLSHIEKWIERPITAVGTKPFENYVEI